MQHVSPLRRVSISRQLFASTSTQIHRRTAIMASASSDSGLWRTTSGSTASSSGDYAHKSTGPISAAGAIDRTLNGHANRSSLHDHGNARRTPSKRIRRRKAKVVKNDDSAPSDSGAASCLPGFVAATSLTSRQSPSAVKLVATNIDVKGKGRTVDDELVMDSPTFRPIRPESTSLAPGHSLQASAIPAEDIEGDQTAPVDDSTVFPAGEASSEDSAASSTDELPYAPSPTVSPHVTPQAKVGLRALSVTPKSSPFKAPITGFEFLAARNNTLFGTSSWISKSNEPQTTGLGIAGKGLEALPVKKEGETTFQLKAPQNDLNIIGPTKKKVASSPLTWSTDHKVLDAATLGSPTLGSMKESEDQEELARNAITKAAFSVNQATILQELAKRKAQRKLELEANALAPSVTLTISRSDEPEVKPLARNNDENENKDGVKRRDMATSHWKPLPASSDVDLMANGKANGEAAASSAPERSPLLGGGATSATADAEEEVDDGASEASNTSFLIHAVVRDGDMASGWEALDSSYDTTEKKRVRLENAIYELDKRHRPSPAVIAARREMLLAIRKRLNWMLKDWAPDFQYRLETFGSTKYGLDTDSSDLDLCIVDPHRPDGFRNACDLYDLSEPINGPKDINASTEEDEENIPSTPFSRHKRNKKWAQADTRKKMTLGDVYDVHRLADLLRKMGHQEIIAIPNAVVPIIKFKSREGIKADMNCNEQLGVRNSILISEYISLNPIVRPFLIFLKVWAKQRRLNDPSGQKGLMSLSSYSLVLMAIAYLQHAGIVPNLQEHALISQHGVSRQTFWSKVPNPDAPKAGHWTKRKFLGDYKAMAIDTTFVKAAQLIPQAQVPAASIASTDVKANASKAKSAATGWDSESETPVEKGIEVSRNPTQLLKLLEGFFEYYLGFPIENKAISVWRGKPIDRRVPFDDANQSSKKPRRLSRALRKAADHSSLSEDSGESGPSQQERNDGPSSDNVNDQRRLSDGETTATSETNTITDDEELRALYEKMEDTMRKLGVKDDTPSFELTLKSRKPSKKKKLSKGINGHNEGEEVTLPAMQEIDALEQLEGGDIGGSASSVHKGLDLSQASRDTNLFPIPPVEDPENFVEPPTWTQPLVVQDPFIHTRNTTMNIVPETVNLIWKEMQRALDMLKSGERLDKICENIRHDSAYKRKSQFRSHREIERRRAERTEQKKANRVRKARHKAVRRAEQAARQAEGTSAAVATAAAD